MTNILKAMIKIKKPSEVSPDSDSSSLTSITLFIFTTSSTMDA